MHTALPYNPTGSYTTFHNDVWSYNLGESGWSKIVTSGTSPAPKAWFGFATPTNSTFYVHGGQDNLIATNSLFKFNVSSSTWVEVTIRASVGSPPMVDEMGFGTDTENLYMATGYRYFSGSANGPSAESWKFNLQAGTWSNVTPAASSCLARWQGAMAVIGSNRYVFGGSHDGYGLLNDLIKYTDGACTVVTPDRTASTSPARRAFPAMGVLGGKILIYGGTGILNGVPTHFNDLWEFDPATGKWKELIKHGQSGSPEGRGQNAALASNGIQAYLFGGITPTGGLLNDFWRLCKISFGLLDLRVTPNPIVANSPFTISWKVNSTGGSDRHKACIGSAIDCDNYENTGGSRTLIAPNTLSNFSLFITVNDLLCHEAKAGGTLDFFRN